MIPSFILSPMNQLENIPLSISKAAKSLYPIPKIFIIYIRMTRPKNKFIYALNIMIFILIIKTLTGCKENENQHEHEKGTFAHLEI